MKNQTKEEKSLTRRVLESTGVGLLAAAGFYALGSYLSSHQFINNVSHPILGLDFNESLKVAYSLYRDHMKYLELVSSVFGVSAFYANMYSSKKQNLRA